MRETEAKGYIQTNLLQGMQNPPVHVTNIMRGQRLRQNIINGMAGMQRPIGILKHHLHQSIKILETSSYPAPDHQ